IDAAPLEWGFIASCDRVGDAQARQRAFFRNLDALRGLEIRLSALRDDRARRHLDPHLAIDSGCDTRTHLAARTAAQPGGLGIEPSRDLGLSAPGGIARQLGARDQPALPREQIL